MGLGGITIVGGGVGAGEMTVGRAVVDPGVSSGRVVVVVVQAEVAVAVAAAAAAAAAATSGVIDSPSATAASAGAPSPGGVVMVGAASSGALCSCGLCAVCCVLCGGRGGEGELRDGMGENLGRRSLVGDIKHDPPQAMEPPQREASQASEREGIGLHSQLVVCVSVHLPSRIVVRWMFKCSSHCFAYLLVVAPPHHNNAPAPPQYQQKAGDKRRTRP